MRVRAGVLLVVAAALGGCGGYKRVCPVRPLLPDPPAAQDVIEVRFLGVGGFLIRRTSGDSAGRRVDALMTPPLYSNPTFGEIAWQDVFSDQRLIDALLPPVDDVQVILVGHGHYDHLMDVPYVALTKAKSAKIYGNDAVRDVLAPLARRPDFRDRVVSLRPYANDPCDWFGECVPGHTRWEPYAIAGTRLRVWTILSEHPAQFSIPLLSGRIHLWRGQPLEPGERLPTRVSGWPEGTTLAFVVDFLDREAPHDAAWDSANVAFRVYYQDAPARDPFGVPPTLSRAARCAPPRPCVDLALLCVGGAGQVPGHPQAILGRLRPRYAIGHHWEDFFNPRTLPLPRPEGGPRAPVYETIRGLPAGSPTRFEKHLRAALPRSSEYTLPCPDAITRFERRGGRFERVLSSETWRRGNSP